MGLAAREVAKPGAAPSVGEEAARELDATLADYAARSAPGELALVDDPAIGVPDGGAGSPVARHVVEEQGDEPLIPRAREGAPVRDVPEVPDDLDPMESIGLVPGTVVPLLTHTADPAGDWKDQALCAETDPEAFFPEKGGSTREAKRICMSCEVRIECLGYALAHDERFGIWGGLSERERRRLKKRVG